MSGDLPRGLSSVSVLGAQSVAPEWDVIVVPDSTKERLLNHALVCLLHGEPLSALPGSLLGRLIILSGPAGTGKSTLARGLAQVLSAELGSSPVCLAEIDAHELPSEMLGESQRAVTSLLRSAIPRLAEQYRYLVIVIDEVESFAVSRSMASFEANPVDVHRATDAVLSGLDYLCRHCPSVLMVVTTNLLSALDHAFVSRADMVIGFELPDETTAAAIIARSLEDLAEIWPRMTSLATDAELHRSLARRCPGWDGRRLRRLAVQALSGRAELARDPALLEPADLLAVAGSRTDAQPR